MVDYKQYEGKEIIIKIQGDKPDVSGKVLRGSIMGILIRNKATHQSELIEAECIEGVELAPEIVRGTGKILVRDIAPVSAAAARQHLADRHGVPISRISTIPDIALEYHQELHEELELAHRHVAKRTPQERAADLAEVDTGVEGDDE